MNKKVFYSAWVIFFAILAIVGGVGVKFYEERSAMLGKIEKLQSRLAARDHLVPEDKNLPASAGLLAAAALQSVVSKKEELKNNGTPFVFVDLRAMQVELYDSNGTSTTLPVLTKGREGSWWETPTGDYSVVGKEQNHFSSIGKVWMPWSIQFYGNFFIHGWPYYEDGEPVAQTYSGGCIRLSIDDAKLVYDFVKKGTPILIREDGIPNEALPPLVSNNYRPVPGLTASSVLVADVFGGDVLLDKSGDRSLPMASLAKLMTGVVASELIYLERSITITPAMLSAKIQSFPFKSGDNYSAFDLLYPMLMESSNGAASAIASFIGEASFVKAMNTKAKSLGMKDTVFADPAGILDGNVATARDLSTLMAYILDKRYFLLDITKGKNYLQFGPSHFSDIKNFNEFAGEESLIGMKNGETTDAKQTILSLWKLKDSNNAERDIVIVVLGSDDRAKDTEALLNWVKASFGLD
ncbi:MAG: L,D-transpeptidase family protein [bacterium]|nr:L,D-transpeptidase family protein [bacterium]